MTEKCCQCKYGVLEPVVFHGEHCSERRVCYYNPPVVVDALKTGYPVVSDESFCSKFTPLMNSYKPSGDEDGHDS